jgi:hypothetical protein
MVLDINLKGGAKLVETCFRFLGGLWEPTAIRRRALAKAEEKDILGKAEQREEIRKIETKAMKALRQRELLDNFPVLAKISPEFHEFAKNGMSRVIVQEARRQQNIEAIVGQAALNLPEDSQVNDEPVEEDWINNFFENCKDIGDTEMQALWGKILAGEVAQPGSYSRRALAILKLMNTTDVKLFEEFYVYVWAVNNIAGQAINCPPGGDDLLAARGCVPSKRMHLADIGLLRRGAVNSLRSGDFWTLQYESDFFTVKNEKGGIVNSHGEMLTNVGAQLIRLAKVESDYQYRDDVLAMFAKEDLTVTHIKGPNPPA